MKPPLSITTDYAGMTKGSPQPYLKRIAEAGFSHVHWCHQWNTDFIYSRAEVAQIKRWLKEYGLKLLDLHASHGIEKKYMSVLEYERLSGVELVKNRLDLTARLGGGVIILHITYSPEQDHKENLSLDQLRRSFDAFEPYARKRNVRIAMENGSFPRIIEILAEYGENFLGVCYDSGHGNALGNKDGLDQLELVKDRLISLHLHDNDGTADQHLPPFMGTVDWPRLARIIARSSYAQCVSMESNMSTCHIKDEAEFLAFCFQAGLRFHQMIEEERKLSTA